MRYCVNPHLTELNIMTCPRVVLHIANLYEKCRWYDPYEKRALAPELLLISTLARLCCSFVVFSLIPQSPSRCLPLESLELIFHENISRSSLFFPFLFLSFSFPFCFSIILFFFLYLIFSLCFVSFSSFFFLCFILMNFVLVLALDRVVSLWFKIIAFQDLVWLIFNSFFTAPQDIRSVWFVGNCCFLGSDWFSVVNRLQARCRRCLHARTARRSLQKRLHAQCGTARRSQSRSRSSGEDARVVKAFEGRAEKNRRR